MAGLDSIKWKIEECVDGKHCWCRLISPVVPYVDADGREWYNIVDSGAIRKDLAEYIVKIHNDRLDRENNVELKTFSKNQSEYLKEEIEKYEDIKVIYDHHEVFDKERIERVRNGGTYKSIVGAAREYFNNLFKSKKNDDRKS